MSKSDQELEGMPLPCGETIPELLEGNPSQDEVDLAELDCLSMGTTLMEQFDLLNEEEHKKESQYLREMAEKRFEEELAANCGPYFLDDDD
jgi:hypothetical protein